MIIKSGLVAVCLIEPFHKMMFSNCFINLNMKVPGMPMRLETGIYTSMKVHTLFLRKVTITGSPYLNAMC